MRSFEKSGRRGAAEVDDAGGVAVAVAGSGGCCRGTGRD